MLDVALLVPLESDDVRWIDPIQRRTCSPAFYAAVRARHQLEELVGRSLRDRSDLPDCFPREDNGYRSLTAASLGTALERAGLSWTAIDPGVQRLSYWRKRLGALRAERPRLVALSTTFVNTPAYAASLCAMIRELFPDATLAVGGYLYATDARRFLQFDADVLCVGEGETRIVDIVRAVRDGRSLDGIPGLYLRRPDGSLRFTGRVEPLALGEIPTPDWPLARRRVDPPVPAGAHLAYHVETQRGCVFKCEFCTFRTLAAPTEHSVERAVDEILAAANDGPGFVLLVDATATFPADRFKDILRRLVARGGSRAQIGAYARVSDLDDEMCALMARAGVVHLNIGQETGSQRLLNAMKKGTRADQVAPAIRLMSKHGIRATFNFFHGFPGEDDESLRETREMLVSLNEPCAESPVVPFVMFDVFNLQDFAAVSRRESLQGYEHGLDYDRLPMGASRAAWEVLTSCVEMSRVPHAPVTGFGYGVAATLIGMHSTPRLPAGGPEARACFDFGKVVDRGLAAFVDKDLAGREPDRASLWEIREGILAAYGAARPPRASDRPARWALRRLASRLGAECAAEGHDGIGWLTRLHLGRTTYGATGSVRAALAATVRGEYPPLGYLPERAAQTESAAPALADDLIAFGVEIGKRKRTRPATPAPTRAAS